MDPHIIPIGNESQPRSKLRLAWGWWVIIVLGICIWGWLDVRRRGYSYPEDPLHRRHKTDVTVYTEAGAAFFDGRPPYEVSNPRGFKYLYPPLFAMVLAPLHVLPTQDQVTVWFVVSLLMCWGCFYECAKTLRYICAQDLHLMQRYKSWFPWLGAAAAVAALLPTVNCLQVGQVGILKLYLLVLGVRLVLSGRTNWTRLLGGVVLALPIVVKLVPVLPVSFFVFVQFVAWIKSFWTEAPDAAVAGRRLVGSSLGIVLGLLLFVLIIPAMLVGWKANWHHLNTWSEMMFSKANDGGEEQFPGPRNRRNQSLHNAVYRLGNFVHYMAADGPNDNLAENPAYPKMYMDSPWAKHALLAVKIAILATLGMAYMRLGAEGDLLSICTAFGLACVAMLLISPISRGHYFMQVVPAILYLPLWLDRRNHRRRFVKFMAIFPCVLIYLHYIFMPYAGRVGLLGLGMSGWLFAAMILVARGCLKTTASVSYDDVPRKIILPAVKKAA